MSAPQPTPTLPAPVHPPEASGKKTILVVEDDRGHRLLLHHALKHRYRVLEATDADSAIAVAERGNVHLVLLDLHLPPFLDSPGEGLRVQRRLRELDPQVPVVVLSGNPDPVVRQELLDHGVRAFLEKPADATRLERVLGDLL